MLYYLNWTGHVLKGGISRLVREHLTLTSFSTAPKERQCETARRGGVGIRDVVSCWLLGGDQTTKSDT